MKTAPPTTSEGVERYLANGFVKGIGPVLAKKLVGHFGAEVLHSHGVSPGRAVRIYQTNGNLAIQTVRENPQCEKPDSPQG